MDFLSEFGMREWLIAGGVILVFAVLVDGIRRMRNENKTGIKISLGLGGGFADHGDYSTELPNGGGRVIRRTDPTFDGGDPEELLASDDFDADEALSQLRDEGDFQSSEKNEPVMNTDYTSKQEILVIHVKAKSADGFNGSDLLQILLACDLRYGDKDILHRHEQADGEGYLQFSVANMIEPGTFSLEDINSFRTPGVTFFMTLPGPEDLSQAFECMIETANCLVKNLDAVLLDEDHSTATLQVVNQYRERIRQFKHKQAVNPEPV